MSVQMYFVYCVVFVCVCFFQEKIERKGERKRERKKKKREKQREKRERERETRGFLRKNFQNHFSPRISELCVYFVWAAVLSEVFEGCPNDF